MPRMTSKILSTISKRIQNAVFDIKDPLIFQHLTDFHETINSLLQIFDDYRTHLDPNQLKRQFQAFLAHRARLVANTPICYTLEPNSLCNEICQILAKYCAPDNYIELLLPAVAPQDIFGSTIADIGMGNFILTDAGTQFIGLESVVETAFTRMSAAEEELYLTTTMDGAQRSLTPSELAKLGNICDRISEIAKKMNEKGFWERWFQSNQSRFFVELTRLREGLRSGDVHHQGAELNAGRDANVAIVAFKNYYDRLPQAKRTEIEAIGTGNENLGEIFNRLFRDPEQAAQNNGMATIYCIALIGRALDASLTKNRNKLLGINLSKQEIIESMKDELIADVKTRHNIQLGKGQIKTLSHQKAELIHRIETTGQREAYSNSHCLKLFIQFVSDEIEKCLLGNKYDLKCEHYLKLLVRMVFTEAILPHRDNALSTIHLIEFFNIIEHITSATRGHFKPSSVNRWEQFLEEHQLLNDYPFIHHSNPPINPIKNITFSWQALKLPESYIQSVHQAEEDQDATEKLLAIHQQPIPSFILHYGQPMIDFIFGSNAPQHLLENNQTNPHRFFVNNFRKIATATAVAAGAGAVWLISNMMS